MRGIPIANTPTVSGSAYAKNNESIGSQYIKSLFKGYTGSDYRKHSEQPYWLGFQGPLIEAEVGDMVEVMLYNNLTTQPISAHNMGLQYTPDSEGSNYYRGVDANGTTISYPGDAIQPGSCFVYKWLVTTRSQPDQGPSAPATKLWSYHGDQNLQYDVMNGLFGPVLIYNRGQMAQTKKTTKQFVMLCALLLLVISYARADHRHSFATTDEYQSYYLVDNIQRFAAMNPSQTAGASTKVSTIAAEPLPTPTATANATIFGNIFRDMPPVPANSSLADLAQSFTVINGYAFQSMPTLQICQDEQVEWHFYSMGSFNDGFHAVHSHGNNFKLSSGNYRAAIPLLPASSTSVSMKAENVGVWQLLCHVAAHWQAGMEVLYNVQTKGSGMC